MKKNKILLALSIIEILSLIIFIATFEFALGKTLEIAVSGWMSSWLGSKVVNLSIGERILIMLNDITPYIFLVTLLIRFLYTYKKNKLIILLDLLIGFIAFALFFTGQSIFSVLGIIFLIITLLLYIYSHIIFNDNYTTEKKSKKISL